MGTHMYRTDITDLRFGIYARISADNEDTQAGVMRQLADCRAFLARFGVVAVDEYVDNSISAYSGDLRPDYERLLADIKAGKINAPLAYHLDRFHREMVGLSLFIEQVCKPRKLTIFTTNSGDFDTTTADGRGRAYIVGTMANSEVGRTQERIVRANKEGAEKGRPHPGIRQFGFTHMKAEHDPREMPFVVEMFEQLMAGASYRSIALYFNDCGLRTSRGNLFQAKGIEELAKSPAYAGYRQHIPKDGGEVAYYPGQWKGCISWEYWQEVQAILEARKGHARHDTRRKYLCMGLVYCACGKKMSLGRKGSAKKGYYSIYRCLAKDAERGTIGCGKVSVQCAPLDDLLTDAVLYRMAGAKLQTDETNADTAPLIAQRDQINRRIAELDDMLATAEITRAKYLDLYRTADARRQNIEAEILKLSSAKQASYLPLGKNFAAAWEANDITWQHRALTLLVRRITIMGTKSEDDSGRPIYGKRPRYKQWLFDIERVQVDWLA